MADGGGSEPEIYAGSEKNREKYSGGNLYIPSPLTGGRVGVGGDNKLFTKPSVLSCRYFSQFLRSSANFFELSAAN